MTDFLSRLFAGVPPLVQLLGVACILLTATLYFNREHEAMIRTKLVADTGWLIYAVFNYVYVGGSLPAAAISLVALLRSAVFLFRDRGAAWASGRGWLWGFIAFTAVTTGITWCIEGFNPLALLTLTASIIAIVSFYQPSARVSRALSFVITGLTLSYYICDYRSTGGSLAAMISDILTLLVAVCGVLLYDVRGHSRKTET